MVTKEYSHDAGTYSYWEDGVDNPEVLRKTTKRLIRSKKSRDDTLRIQALRAAQREQIKHTWAQEEEGFQRRWMKRQREGKQRWAKVVSQSPLGIDLVAEFQLISEQQEIQNILDQRGGQMMKEHETTAQSAIFNKAVQQQQHEEALRQEKRDLLWMQQRRLPALRDITGWQIQSNKHAAKKKAMETKTLEHMIAIRSKQKIGCMV